MHKILQTSIDHLHLLYSLWGSYRHRKALRTLRILGVTGTDGKSSVVYFVAHILNHAGHRTAFYSSFGLDDGTGMRPNPHKMTTPGKAQLHAFLDRAYRNGCTHAVLEITSEGIKQHRHFGIPFCHTAITNLTPEHTESHGGFAPYTATKLSLLTTTLAKGGAVTACIDTPAVAQWARTHPNARTVTMANKAATYTCHEETSQLERAGVTIRATVTTEHTSCTLPFGGPFTARNATLALAIADGNEVPLSVGAVALATAPIPPGRFEVLHHNPLIVVDYAHTLAALGELLPFVRTHVRGTLIHVFGAAGGLRDHAKRPKLASLSQTHTDHSIVTEENPWDEPPSNIERDILAGFTDSHHTVTCIPRREDAVRRAFALAGEHDCILLTAKGAETVIAEANGTRRPYEERAFVRTLCTAH